MLFTTVHNSSGIVVVSNATCLTKIEAHEIHHGKGLDFTTVVSRSFEHHVGDCTISLVPPNVAAVAEWYRYRIVACLVTSSIPVPLKTRRVGQRCTLNLSRAETSSRWCGVVVRRGVPAQVSSTSLDHGSKLRGPSPKALV
ncbi:uncharacterized protein TNCV_4972471 [Trichonephila clavipes]|nr:uncharacterized protein TNCV_4972471 [Trichonephila clavipes]